VLHVATKLHNYEAVQLLIQRQADIDALNGDGATPLILAAEVGDEVLVKFFLENGCNKNIKDKHSKSHKSLTKFTFSIMIDPSI
jgi:ankyrin repeat protein